MTEPVTESPRFATAKVARGAVLDSRLALYHEAGDWLALADLHYGYEVHRSRMGALLPQWGMGRIEERLWSLLDTYRPGCVILVGDIMDGAGSATETEDLLAQLRRSVGEVICLAGNHDRPALKKRCEFKPWHRIGEFLFHHGHRFGAIQRDTETGREKEASDSATAAEVIHITGHEHPTASFTDGAGLRLKLPALVAEQIAPGQERWILPAFSPWAGGGDYESGLPRLGTWACSAVRILSI